MRNAPVAAALACALLCLSNVADCRAADAAPPAVKVLDDFEGGAFNWDGDYVGSIAEEYATHGGHALKVVFEEAHQYPGITARSIDTDWSGYDTLKMDIFNPQGEPVNLGIRIDDDKSTGYSSRYNGEFLLVNGQMHLEIPFGNITGSGTPLDLSKVTVFTIFMSSPARDTVLYFDNIRLTRGPEGAQTRGRDIIISGDSPELKALEEKASQARARLSAVITVADKRGIGTLEANIALITAGLGLDVRPKLPWYANRKAELYAYVADSCQAACNALEDTIKNKRSIAPVPPIYNTAALKFDGPFFAENDAKSERRPVLLFSMLYHDEGPLCEYFSPLGYMTYTHSFPGASRYDVERTPLYKAFHEYPDTHRVWNNDEGWCGHIVRDSSSMGGGKEPVVVCLESAHTRAAIEEYIRQHARDWKDDPKVRVNIMGGELSYICYCPETLRMFRRYLAGQYDGVSALNAVWGTKLTSFDEIDVMPNAAQAGENRARWYDWQAFNCWRFVEHAKWAKSVIRKIDANIPVSVGAVSYSVRADFGRSGVDEENLIRQVDDVVLNEAGPSTITTDLLWSLSDGAKPMVDFEYHGDVPAILPHFLHGNAAMAMWWWPDKVDTEFPQFNETALPYSWNIPLADVAEALKIGLDVRRIGAEIAAFPVQPAEIAILYSRASMLQVPPEFLDGTETPYTIELKSAYAAALGLDAPVRFVSSVQVREGKLSRYKVLVVPAAAYVYDDEAQAIFDFAEHGGSVVVAPDSLLFDQYARPRNHLDKLGLSIRETVAPKYKEGDLSRDAFLQGMIRRTSTEGSENIFMACGPGAVLPEGTVLEGSGVFQKLALSSPARIAAKTTSGDPGLVEIPYGGGAFYYLAVPLAPESMNALLDAVATRAGVSRPVRFALASGKRDWRIEARAAQAGYVTLLYITNHEAAPVTVRVSLPEPPEAAVDLRDPWKKLDLAMIEVPANRTGLYAVRNKGAPR